MEINQTMTSMNPAVDAKTTELGQAAIAARKARAGKADAVAGEQPIDFMQQLMALQAALPQQGASPQAPQQTAALADVLPKTTDKREGPQAMLVAANGRMPQGIELGPKAAKESSAPEGLAQLGQALADGEAAKLRDVAESLRTKRKAVAEAPGQGESLKPGALIDRNEPGVGKTDQSGKAAGPNEILSGGASHKLLNELGGEVLSASANPATAMAVDPASKRRADTKGPKAVSLNDSPASLGGGMSGADFLSMRTRVSEASARDSKQGQSDGGQGQPGRGELSSLSKGRTAPKFGETLAANDSIGNAFSDQLAMRQAAPEGATGRMNGSDLKTANSVTGHVVQGSGARDRLSSESLVGISSEIRNLSQSGGGEMRIRLKPENLGEIHVRVTTRGNSVGLSVQASDEKAKQVLEESVSHLKESLSAHRLTLDRADFSVGAPHGAGSSNSGQAGAESGNGSFRWDGVSDGNGQGGSGGFARNGWDGSQSNQGQSQLLGRDPWGQGSAGLAATARGMARQLSQASGSQPGRLDVMA